MKKILFGFIALGIIACSSPQSNTISVIPKVADIQFSGGSFELSENTAIVCKTDKEKKIAGFLIEAVELYNNITLTFKEAEKDAIILSVIESEKLGKEDYKLEVTKDKIHISASGSAGLFYGVQSLIQLAATGVNIPALIINDSPRFKWRGMHLDVSRHFRTVDEIKKFIDILAMHKLNVFHWHLTDDQGWRIEIKKYPKLTEIGAWREDRRGEIWNLSADQREPYDESKPYYGGFYTQDEIKDIVAYAEARQITIVPEIEMPGHSRAALVAYPEVSCFGKETQVPPTGFVGDNWDFSDPFCAGNDEAFEFLQNVLNEVMELFPSQYIHIGGDECSKRIWKTCPKCQARIKKEGLKNEFELQSYFIQRIEKYVRSKGRQIIGWQEILEGGMNPSAAIMPWRGASALEVCKEAAEGGHEVVMAPSSYLYFNSNWPGENINNRGNKGLNIESVYSYNPILDELDEKYHSAITGVNGCAWGEYLFTMDDVEYQTMPRIAALAEIAWTPNELKNYTYFLERVQLIKAMYKKLDVNYYVEMPGGLDKKTVFLDKATLNLDPPKQGSVIKYTNNSKLPTMESNEYTAEVEILETTVIKAVIFDVYGQPSKVKEGLFEKQNYIKSVSGDNIEPGVKYEAFNGKFRGTAKIQGEPVKSGIMKTIGIIDENNEANAGLIIFGYISIPVKAVYTFSLSSDDGSVFMIGNKVVVDHDGYHGGKDRNGNLIYKSDMIALDAGLHPITIKYFDWGSGEMLRLFIESPEMKTKEVSADMLFHSM